MAFTFTINKAKKCTNNLKDFPSQGHLNYPAPSSVSLSSTLSRLQKFRNTVD
jgi:hypothetical protein